MSINNQVSGSTFPVIPANWQYHSRQFESNSDALSENIMVFRPIKDRHDSRAAGSPIKVVIDSPSSFLRPQRTYLSCRITHYNADGSPNTGVTASDIGLMSHFKTATLRVSGKIVEEYSEYVEHIAQQYTYETSARRKYLRLFEGTGNADAIKNSNGSAVVRHHLRFGFLNNINGNPIPLCLLPNQAMEVQLTLNTPQQAVTNAPSGGYFVVDDVRVVAQLTTPSAEFLWSAWAGIRNGKYLELDYVAGVQTVNPCSGASQNNFIIPLSNSRVVGLMHRFRDDSKYSTTTGDKSLIYDRANLISWRYQLGQWRLPLTEEFKVEDSLINAALWMSDSENYETEDVDFENFDSKRFTIRHNFQSADEGMSSALNLTGSDGNLRLITTHSNPPPSTSVSLLTTVFVHRTLLIGNTVDVL
ncbi:hypothetical protein HDU85_006860 [Gaertneriomyces sp. JEL0708]|nr:hypothetical protein HDU85_006860 [Gaertneriomyces sp. JEL0708]